MSCARPVQSVRVLFVASALAAGLGPAAGADPVQSDPPADPPTSASQGLAYDVYVTGEGEVVEQIGPRRVIDRELIEERSARTLDEALQFEPGIYVRTGNEGVPRVDMRGLRSRNVLLLLDGIPYNSTEDGQFDPSLIPTEGMERIRLNFGNASVLYGDGAMAGVIQIETQQPEDGLHGSVGGDFRSEDQVLGRFTLGGRRGDFDGFAAGSGFYHHGFPLSDSFSPTGSENGDRRNNSEKERLNLLLKGGWTPNETMRFDALFTALHGNFEIPPNTADDPNDPFASRVRYERVKNLYGFSGQLSMQWDPQGPLQLRSWFYANQLAENRRRYDNDSYDSFDRNGSFRSDNESMVFGYALHGAWAFGEYGNLRGVFQTRREDFRSDGKVRQQGNWNDFDDHFHQTVYNLGLEYDVKPLPDVGVTLGYGHSFLDKDSGESDDSPTFLVGSYWDLLPGTRLRASVARKVRFPSLRQLYEQGRGDPDLKAEHSWDYEVGITQQLPGRTVLDVTGFWTDVEDFIEGDEVTGLFANQDEYRFRGVEVTLQTQPIEPLDLLASYSFLHSENQSSGTDQNGLQNRPEHRIALESRYRLPWGFAVRGALYYVADQIVYARSGPAWKQHTGNYFLTDLRLAKTLLDDRLSLYFGVNNVTDDNYQESYGVPGPGRVFFGGVQANF